MASFQHWIGSGITATKSLSFPSSTQPPRLANSFLNSRTSRFSSFMLINNWIPRLSSFQSIPSFMNYYTLKSEFTVFELWVNCEPLSWSCFCFRNFPVRMASTSIQSSSELPPPPVNAVVVGHHRIYLFVYLHSSNYYAFWFIYSVRVIQSILCS